MLDYEKLADEVSALLKQKETTFDNAFITIMKQYPVITGEAWKEAKSKIGSILAKRPRKPRTKKAKGLPKTETLFCVLASDTRSVEFLSKYGTTFKFGKSREGVPVLFSYSGTCQPSDTHKKDAEEFAKYFFAQPLALKQIFGVQGITLKESSATRIVLLIDNTFSALFMQTDKGVTAHVTREGEVVRQKDVPQELMGKARAIARTHFKGASSLLLNFG